jgi:ribonuclease HII
VGKILCYDKAMAMNLILEKKLKKKGHSFVIGIDEAGRGALAGPVVAVATAEISKSHHIKISKYLLSEVNDSKKLSPKKREKICEILKNAPKSAGSEVWFRQK